MVEPTVIARSEHSISRRDIDPDALKVLYRLHEHNYVAYLVGGSVRDLLLGRRPKDFDVGTSAHPHQVKKLFRNCWIIGRRFRLAHIKYGPKTIEVATFRRQVDPSELPADAAQAAEAIDAAIEASPDIPLPPDATIEEQVQSEGTHLAKVRAHDRLIHRDNTFGTPEEDAFRRDFTINALFYDIGTYAIIDYVGGLQDLEHRLIRSIGDPGTRFLEDPVRMLRAVVFAARLDFTIDEPILEAFDTHRHEIGRAAPARLMEEYFKILRSGSAEKTFRMLKETRLLREITPELDAAPAALWDALARLDRYRHQFQGAPETLTNAILAGTLLAPLGLAGRERRFSADALERRVELGVLPIPRRDVERLHQILALQPRLHDLRAPFRAQRALLHRHVLGEALTWLEIHGNRPDALEHWRALQAEPGPGAPADPLTPGAPPAFRRRRRRRRRPRTGRSPA
ncbi:MAG TPA: polynucleotide adenylyltransferase PcnB [Vicinamibacterales bacterium]|nr:polynucleotide adenylyltransferase PcnB [Vicinamibacterales bacterium]